MREDAERCGTEGQMLSFDDCQSDPSRRKSRAKLAVRKKPDIAGCPAQTGYKTVRAIGYVGGCFTVRTPIAPHIPARSLLVNVHGAPAFVIAVVPFHQIRLTVPLGPKSRQFTRLSRPQQWAGQDSRELHRPQARRQCARLVFPVRRQCDVGESGMLARDRPSGLPVSNQVKLQRGAHGSCIATP